MEYVAASLVALMILVMWLELSGTVGGTGAGLAEAKAAVDRLDRGEPA